MRGWSDRPWLSSVPLDEDGPVLGEGALRSGRTTCLYPQTRAKPDRG
ncbi:hypothetical protein DB32_000638 [Sandaracinus amylolyticus]|uniref:Uncharacterized protein n=1 Tax=Sandaracinus amylolyticus TaxID=927083 RepID=A0A0F6SDI2_9BACT|nr:hypothetical protein DB32_000638 [Sandaracinus amylolyticus]